MIEFDPIEEAIDLVDYPAFHNQVYRDSLVRYVKQNMTMTECHRTNVTIASALVLDYYRKNPMNLKLVGTES